MWCLLLATRPSIGSHKIHHFSFGERTADKAYPLDDLETIPDGQSVGHCPLTHHQQAVESSCLAGARECALGHPVG